MEKINECIYCKGNHISDGCLKRPVLLVTNGDAFVHAGDPSLFTGKELKNYAMNGYATETITSEEYRKRY